ncbi:hypothetical protein V1512DRAFT_45118 [Lipomyces arxii]|uniref:uncharacterized protein n=1 Tax=Lipomyces arxii TaxID=56418 RepID=UPI0034CFAB79
MTEVYTNTRKNHLNDDMSQSMGSLMSSSVFIGSSSHAAPESQIRHLYKKARYFFVNKQFPEAYSSILLLVIEESTLTLHIDEVTRNKSWQLYLAILDRIAITAPDKLKQAFSRAEIVDFKKLVDQGAIWDQVNAAYPSPQQPSPEVVLSLSLLCARHMNKPNIVREKLAVYINEHGAEETTEAQMRILEFYILVILPACERWEEAELFVNSNERVSEEKRQILLSALDRLKSKAEDRIQASQDRERLNKLKRAVLEKSKAPKAEKEMTGSDCASMLSETAITDVTDVNGDRPVPLSQTPIPRVVDMMAFAFRIFKKPDVIIKLLEYVLGISVFLLALAVPENRARLGQVIAQLLAKLRNTLKMGLRISYL